jgi:hypothetical protein
MSKKTEAPEKMIQAGKMISVRIDPKIRYLAEVAAAAKGLSMTDYLEWAFNESFKRVTLRVAPEPEPIYGNNPLDFTMPEPPDPENERIANEAMSVANLAERLWNESEFGRIESLSILAPHRLKEDDAALLQHIHNRKDLQIPVKETHKLFIKNGYQLDRKKIDAEWESIKTAFSQSKEGKLK